jgi:hypothetical protein
MSMRSTIFTCLIGLVGCGEDAVVPPEVDAPTGNHPEPRVIAGGGIGDGAIDGVVNLYVIDDDLRTPIAGAEVLVGDIAGATDADGLFVAEGVVGPQDVVVKATGKRKEMWVGVDGANVTINLHPDNQAAPASKMLSGAITGYDTVAFTPGHIKLAFISYSLTDRLGDPANEIVTPTPVGAPFASNICGTAVATDPCNFSIATRTGKIALFAVIIDLDQNGTPNDDTDDISTVIGFAVRQGIDTATASGNQNLTLISAANTQNVTVDFGSPPAGLTQRGAVIGIEVGDEGLISATSAFNFTGSPTLKVPKLTALSGATGYRLTGFVGDGAAVPAQSVVLRRGLTGTTLAAGSWLAPPSGLSLKKTGTSSWTNSADATVHSIELTSGSSQLLNVSVFDSSRTSFEMPSLIALPSGPINAAVNAMGATDFDVTNFSLDTDTDKIDRVGGQATTL